MGKKIWYSRPLSFLWSQYNDFFKHKKGTPEEFYRKMEHKFLSYFGISSVQRRTNLMILDLWHLEVNKKFVHIYFKSKELRDYLQDEVSLLDFGNIIDFLFTSGETFFLKPENFDKQNVNLNEQAQVYSFGISVPYENEAKGYAFQLIYYGNRKRISLLWSVGFNQGVCRDASYQKFLKSTDEDSRTQAKLFRLAINTIAYMQAFPECVKNRSPSNDLKEYSYMIETSEEFSKQKNYGRSNRFMTPHCRRAYFKRLSSEFYTHKRGQVIFVSETEVNGISKTVKKSNNKSKIKDFELGKL